jgi:N-acetylglucosaminyldiphosphoundecaprenol N-acetyl-beta-D-mannosaminyltransferase
MTPGCLEDPSLEEPGLESPVVSAKPAAKRCLPFVGRSLAKRVFDFTLAALLCVLTAPVWLLVALRILRLEHTPRVGWHGNPFVEFSLARGLGSGLPKLLNILLGQMSFVGPRAVSPDDPLLTEPDAEWRFDVPPGLVCLHSIRQRVNIDYLSEVEADLEYIATRSFRGDLGILLRAAISGCIGLPPTKENTLAEDRVSILGLSIDNLTMNEAVAEIVERMDRAEPSHVCFLNADCLNIACRDREYTDVVRRANCVLADGIGLKLAGQILGQTIRQNVNGTDLFPRLCAALEGTGQGVFLLGGRPGVAEAVAQWMAARYPAVDVRGTQHGYFAAAEEPQVIQRIAASGASVLLVAFGAPRQEKWIDCHLRETGVRVAVGVGGLFDFYSGRMPRAPLWMRELGCEWLFRFWQEPRRLWRRYFVGNGLFLARVMWSKYAPSAR